LFINDLNEFKPNECLCIVDVVSMFVNDVVCDRDIVSSGKEISGLRLLGCARYPDSTGTLDSHEWRLPVREESKEVHMILSEVFEIWAWSE